MITASPDPRQPRRWQDDMAAAVTAPEALVAGLGLSPELTAPALRASRAFAVRVPESFIRRCRMRGLQTLPVPRGRSRGDRTSRC